MLAAVLPLVVLLAFLGAGALGQGQKDMRRDAEVRVAAIAADVDRELDAQVRVLQTIAASPLLDGTVDPKAFHDMAERLIADHPLWIGLSLIDVDGQRLLNEPTLPTGISSRVIDRVSHAEAVRTGQPVIGRVIRSPRGNVAFAVFVPVVRQGRVTSVLSAAVKPVAVHGLLQGNGLPSSWRAGVMDSAHRVVTRTIVPDVPTRLATQAALDAMAQSPEGSYRGVGTDGLPLVVVYKVVPGAGWSVHVAMPQSEYEAPFLRAAWLVGAGAVISLVLLGLFLSLLAREMRLRQLESASLEETRRMEALGRMTGGVAHDFNNLLMIVQGSADLLRRRQSADQRSITLTDAIISASQRGQTLVRQLLAFGRRSTHETVSFRLQDRRDDLRELLQRSVHAEVTVRLDLPDDTWTIHADPSALEVALINLAVNAGDAMPDGGTLSITSANASFARGRDNRTGLSGDFVILQISDTGVGIPQQNLAHVFEPFYTTKPTGKGTGLGLSQVYGFALQSNGKATVQSKPGQGATFTLYLPRGGDVASPVEPEPVHADVSDEGRVLLVEDNDHVAAVAEVMLEHMGYHVLRVHDAQAAIEAMDHAGPFDIVLSDIVLGSEMTGIDLAVHLRRSAPGLPVVLMTGHSEALKHGEADAFPLLTKPFNQEALNKAMRRARQSGGPARVAETSSTV